MGNYTRSGNYQLDLAVLIASLFNGQLPISTMTVPGIVPQFAAQVPTEAVLVSGIDATLGSIVGPVTISAARVIGAPINPAKGHRLTFILLQNGTGGFAITWNAVFKLTWADTGNTLNKRSSISVVYDGTNWQQDGAQAPYV